MVSYVLYGTGNHMVNTDALYVAVPSMNLSLKSACVLCGHRSPGLCWRNTLLQAVVASCPMLHIVLVMTGMQVVGSVFNPFHTL
jgi:hypothetical protein